MVDFVHKELLFEFGTTENDHCVSSIVSDNAFVIGITLRQFSAQIELISVLLKLLFIEIGEPLYREEIAMFEALFTIMVQIQQRSHYVAIQEIDHRDCDQNLEQKQEH